MSPSLIEVIKLFFRLGIIAFGGPAAHIAMMEEEVVEKRKWMTREKFLDLVGATNLIPGPNSTEMTMHCGYQRAGIPGLFGAGVAFIFPAVVITGIFAYLYVKFGNLPQVEPFIAGIKPAVLVIILSAVLKLGKKAIKNNYLILLGLIVVALSLYGMSEVLLILTAGLIGALFFYIKDQYYPASSIFIPFLFFQNLIFDEKLALTSTRLFLIFLKVGAVLYGSGYVLFAYLDSELVGHGFLTRPELIDAIAVGQFTPGPVLSTATFIGYQLDGIQGALLATLGIFLPSFFFVLILNPLIDKMRKSKFLGYFLDAVNVSAVAIMIAVLYKMSLDTIIDWKSAIITVIAAMLYFYFKIKNAVYIVLFGAVAGAILYTLF